MQKGGILNSHIAKVLADLGHTDTICIGDCGLPVPEGVQKIDVALTFGVPSFADVLRLVTKHMRVEAIHIGEPMEAENPVNYAIVDELFPANRFDRRITSHEEFKEATRHCKCIIRTGEATPYSNIILQADCIFAPER
ncbi:D-ribose pyranase [Veillonella magna]|jgi:D-ribose pyranase|uniref:D-ribose pyranase n=1 Tax=Veillonella magna TaxID=464322 RepID=UPI00258739B1|nr:D-ribose pyranase [Veillonella magna]